MVNRRRNSESGLDSKMRRELFVELCRGLSVLKTPEEMAKALTDLLYPKEAEAVSKRLQIAQLLVDGDDYLTIRSKLKVGMSTIARVSSWLSMSGEGFKIIFSRKHPEKKESDQEIYDPLSWRNFKRRYNLYFWPQLLVEELIKTSSDKRKKRIYKMFSELDVKRQEFGSDKNKLLYDQFVSYFEKPAVKK